MSWNLQDWKDTVSARLWGWRMRMQELQADSVYMFLTATALAPVLEAVRQGEWSALFVVGGVVSGVGTNLLANLLQQWKDTADSWHDPADGACHLAVAVTAEPALQAELDAILEQLNVVTQAQQHLPEAERAWFVETLRAELERPGHLPSFVAHLTGAGGLAQGAGAIAAGAGGVAVGGDVHGSIFVGSTVHLSGGRYAGPTSEDPDAALAIYRRVLMESCRHMSLRGLDIGASDPASAPQRFDLAQVYVDLNTTTLIPRDDDAPASRERHERLAERRDTRLLRALEAVATHRHLVLLGGPGSGKSTFLTHLALCLAAHGADPQAEWLTRLPGWPVQEGASLPVLVTLRDFARWLPQDTHRTEPRHLWQFIVSRLEAQNLAFVAPPLHTQLEHGRALVLLDGLDEIPNPRQCTLMRDAVTTFLRRYPQNRLVVTCRTLSYQEAAWQRADIPSVTLAEFDEVQIEHFIRAWYTELAHLGIVKPEAVAGLTEHLRTAGHRPDLWRLAANPLLLTVMALVHTHKGRLPEARALLYEETVDLLLWRWEQLKVSEAADVPGLQHLLA